MVEKISLKYEIFSSALLLFLVSRYDAFMSNNDVMHCYIFWLLLVVCMFLTWVTPRTAFICWSLLKNWMINSFKWWDENWDYFSSWKETRKSWGGGGVCGCFLLRFICFLGWFYCWLVSFFLSILPSQFISIMFYFGKWSWETLLVCLGSVLVPWA